MDAFREVLLWRKCLPYLVIKIKWTTLIFLAWDILVIYLQVLQPVAIDSNFTLLTLNSSLQYDCLGCRTRAYLSKYLTLVAASSRAFSLQLSHFSLEKSDKWKWVIENY